MLIALGGAGYSATGGNFILGTANTATTQTRLVTPLAGAAFRVDNTSTAASATGMTIVTNAARPPLAVTSATKVALLNADRVDSLSPSDFSRIATAEIEFADVVSNTPMATTQIVTTMPKTYVSVRASFLTFVPGGQAGGAFPCSARFMARLGGVFDNTRAFTAVNSPPADAFDQDQAQAIEALFVVTPGTHTVEIVPTVELGTCTLNAGYGRLTAQTIAFDQNGVTPLATIAMTAAQRRQAMSRTAP